MNSVFMFMTTGTHQPSNNKELQNVSILLYHSYLTFNHTLSLCDEETIIHKRVTLSFYIVPEGKSCHLLMTNPSYYKNIINTEDVINAISSPVEEKRKEMINRLTNAVINHIVSNRTEASIAKIEIKKII